MSSKKKIDISSKMQQKFEKDNQELGQYFNLGIKVATESFNSECTLPSKSSNFQVLFPWMSIQEFSMSRFPSSKISLIPRKKKNSKIVQFRYFRHNNKMNLKHG